MIQIDLECEVLGPMQYTVKLRDGNGTRVCAVKQDKTTKLLCVTSIAPAYRSALAPLESAEFSDLESISQVIQWGLATVSNGEEESRLTTLTVTQTYTLFEEKENHSEAIGRVACDGVEILVGLDSDDKRSFYGVRLTQGEERVIEWTQSAVRVYTDRLDYRVTTLGGLSVAEKNAEDR